MTRLYSLVLASIILIGGIFMIPVFALPNVREYTLDNGLKVFLIPDSSASLVTVKTFVKTGSITESPYWGSGISHYLEHLLAGGTTSYRSEAAYKKLIANMGGAFNAYTTYDHTAFFINSTPQHLTDAVQAIYEWMFFSTFTNREFNRERDVIIREMEKDKANVDRQFFESCQENFYLLNPLRFPVTGYIDTFKAVSSADVKSYYKSRYIPSNMVLVVGGNINPNVLIKQIKATFGSRPAAAGLNREFVEEPPVLSSREIKKSGNTQVTYVSYRFKTVDLYSEDMYPLDLLEYILVHGKQSVLYRILVDEKKLAYSVDCSSYTPSSARGFFDISVAIDQANKPAVETAIEEILTQAKAGMYSDEIRLNRAKSQKLAENIFSLETIESKVAKVGIGYLSSYNKDYFDLYVKRLSQVQPSEITAVAVQYLDFNKRIVTMMSPKSTSEKETATTENLIQPVRVPEKIVLSNGVRILLYPDKSLPKVEVKAFVLGGIRAETPTNNGISFLLANLLGQGSAHFTKTLIEETVENHGAFLEANVGQNALYYTLTCLSGDLNTLWPFFSDTFLNPVFAESDLTESKRQTSQLIRQRQDNWFDYGSWYFKKHFFGSHPYSLSTAGELSSIKDLTVSQIADFHRRLLDPKQLVITVFGDFDRQSMMQRLEESFSSLATVAKPVIFQAPLSRELHLSPATMNLTVSQDIAAIMIGFDGTTFKDSADSVRLDALDAVLSGMSYPGGRLHQMLREKGLVYMVHADNNLGLEKGYFFIYALTQESHLAEVKEIILSQINAIKSGEVSDAECAEGLSQVDFYYKDRRSSLSALSLISATDELYQDKYDDYVQLEKRLKTVKKSDIIAMAKKYLNNPQILLIKGPATP